MNILFSKNSTISRIDFVRKLSVNGVVREKADRVTVYVMGFPQVPHIGVYHLVL